MIGDRVVVNIDGEVRHGTYGGYMESRREMIVFLDIPGDGCAFSPSQVYLYSREICEEAKRYPDRWSYFYQEHPRLSLARGIDMSTYMEDEEK